METLYDKLSSTADEISKKSFDILKKLRGPLLGDENNEVTSLLIPIVSSEIFYWDLMVLLPYFLKIEIEYENKLKQLSSKLLTCIKKHYVPALALIHEHFFEKIISKQKNIGVIELMGQYDVWLHNDKINGSYYRSPICRRATKVDKSEREKSCYECEYFGWEKSSDNVVEKYLHKLWQDRKTIGERKYINESLFFKNRLYTAPKMLDLLEDFLKPSKAKLKKDEDILPSILVVGSPGSGKEDVPKFIKLFSDCYNRGETYKLNLASLKPDAIAPFAMVGREIAWEECNDKSHSPFKLFSDREETYKLKGILRKIREQTRQELEDFISGKGDFKGSKCLAEKTKEYQAHLETCIKTIYYELLRHIFFANFIREEVFVARLTTSLLIGEWEIRKLIREKDEEGKKLIKKKEKILEKLISRIGDVRKLNVALQKAKSVKEFVEKLEPKERLIVKELFGRFPMIVLDELNSMNMES